jgi:acyl carrier protein
LNWAESPILKIVAIQHTLNYNGISYKGGLVKMSFDKIKDIIVDQLGVEADTVTETTSLMKDLEADSLDAVEIIMAIEEEFDVEIPDEEAENFETIGDIAKYVEANK